LSHRRNDASTQVARGVRDRLRIEKGSPLSAAHLIDEIRRHRIAATVRRRSVRFTVGVASCVAVAAGVSCVALAAVIAELPKGFEKFKPLKPGPYQATLFSPPVQLAIPDADWNGAQWVKGSVHAIVLPRDLTVDAGGMLIFSAPASRLSASKVLQRLRTERASGPNVGMTVEPTVAVKIAGYRGQQFDGLVTGTYGHTFVPFSGKSGDASVSAGDHDRLPRDTAFRIIVLDVGGQVLFFEIDSGGKVSTQDSAVLTDVRKILRSLKFTHP
jgi:hypothetical protein